MGFPSDSVKNPPAVQETTCSAGDHMQPRGPGFDPWVGREDPLEKKMATHSSVLI